MKTAIFCLVICTTLLNLSCTKNVESSPISTNEKPVETTQTALPEPAATPEKDEEIDIIDQFSTMSADNVPAPLEYKGYKISPLTVKKKEDKDSPAADIYDAVLTKNGKRVARFEGVYYPLGNFMSFGLYDFLGRGEKQLVVIDESNRYDHLWIVSLFPKSEVILDAADYGVLYGAPKILDMENDGIKEIAFGKNCSLGFLFSNSELPWTQVIFKYDAKTRRYLPANHIYTEYASNQTADKQKGFSNELFINLIYEGKEDEAWKLFDEAETDFSSWSTIDGKPEGREQVKKYIKRWLNDDPIYRFIKADLAKNKRN